MKLIAGAEFTYQIKEPTPVVTMLRPRSMEGQFIQEDRLIISPSTHVTEYFDRFGNLCQRMLLPVGEVHIKTEVVAEVEHSIDSNISAEYVLIENLPSDTLQYLFPSRYCQSDSYEIGQLAISITKNIWSGYQQIMAIREWIHQNIEYQYGVTYSTTTALDILQTKVGVCRDFTHLAISLCRSINIPSRMVVGYVKDLKFMDLHAWFEVFLGGKWYTFDAVQERTTGGRIVIAYGRDATDVALITQFGASQLVDMRVWVEEVEGTASEIPSAKV